VELNSSDRHDVIHKSRMISHPSHPSLCHNIHKRQFAWSVEEKMARAQLPSRSLGEGLLGRTVLNEDGAFGFGGTNPSGDDEEIRPAVCLVRVCATALTNFFGQNVWLQNLQPLRPKHARSAPRPPRPPVSHFHSAR
jgi:hypothetical protein